MRFFVVAGGRPNIIKASVLLRRMDNLRRVMDISYFFAYTGQHYDPGVSSNLLQEFGFTPSADLRAGSGSHAVQTAKILTGIEELLKYRMDVQGDRYDAVIVFGDMNSTLAAGLAAKKLGLPLVHVEGWIRQWDTTIPEEINRMIVDTIADINFLTDIAAMQNVPWWGHGEYIGQPLIDPLAFDWYRILNAEQSMKLGKLCSRKKYAVCEFHRPQNVDTEEAREKIRTALINLPEAIEHILVISHPRVKWEEGWFGDSRIQVVPPSSYLNFMTCLKNASVVLTDSGGIQNEASFFRVPCHTYFKRLSNSMTSIGRGGGTNRVWEPGNAVEIKVERSTSSFDYYKERAPMYWDGEAGQRIMDYLVEEF